MRTSVLRASCDLVARCRAAARACASSASAAAANARSSAGRAAQRLLGRVRPPRLVRQPAERDPHVARSSPSATSSAAATETSANENEARSRTLRYAELARDRQRRQLDRGDQLAGLEHRVALGRVAGQPVEVDERDLALAAGADDVHDRVERGERDRHVRRMGRDAVLRMAERSRGCGARPRAPGSRVPGSRLLHGFVTSWKYGQRVRCSRLPPVVARLRS